MGSEMCIRDRCEVGLLQIGSTIAVHTGPYALGMGIMRRWKKQ